VAQTKDRPGDDRVRKLHAVEDGRGCALEKAAVVGKNAKRIVALRYNAEDRS
jgi:hypothetical protein